MCLPNPCVHVCIGHVALMRIGRPHTFTLCLDICQWHAQRIFAYTETALRRVHINHSHIYPGHERLTRIFCIACICICMITWYLLGSAVRMSLWEKKKQYNSPMHFGGHSRINQVIAVVHGVMDGKRVGGISKIDIYAIT